MRLCVAAIGAVEVVLGLEALSVAAISILTFAPLAPTVDEDDDASAFTISVFTETLFEFDVDDDAFRASASELVFPSIFTLTSCSVCYMNGKGWQREIMQLRTYTYILFDERTSSYGEL